MVRRRIVDTDSESESESDEESTEEPLEPPQDAQVQRRSKMLIEVLDKNARNLHFPYRLEDQRGEGAEIHEVVSRLQGNMRFVAKTSSEKWKPSFRELLDSCTDIRVERISDEEKRLCRDQDRCVICGTIERRSRAVVHLFCEEGYSANAFMQRLEDLPTAFDTYVDRMGDKAEETLCLPCGEVTVPAGYKGAFAIGLTCLETLKKSMAAQNFFLDQLVQTWEELRDMGDVGSDYQLVPTLTAERTTQVANRIDAIMTGNPDVVSSPRLWAEVEESLEAAAEELDLDRLEIACAIATRAMQGESEEESEEEELEPPARRRRTEASNVLLRRSPRVAAKAPAPTARQAAPRRQPAPAPAPAPATREHGRGAIMQPMQVAGALRAPGLGSRREAAQNLFTLAADLTRSGEASRAAAASAGGLVILELLDKVG